MRREKLNKRSTNSSTVNKEETDVIIRPSCSGSSSSCDVYLIEVTDGLPHSVLFFAKCQVGVLRAEGVHGGGFWAAGRE